MIVVTGGTGLVGSHLLFELIKKNIPVRALVRPQSSPKRVLNVWKYLTSHPEQLMNQVDWHTVDLQNRYGLFEALQGARQVYHCAARVSFDKRYRNTIWQANVELTRNVVNTCLELNIEKLLYVSSVAAIGHVDNGAVANEKSGWPQKPKSIYSETKTLAELEVWRSIEEGLQAVIVNPTVILGPGNWQQGSSRIFDTVYKGLPFYTRGATGFVDVRDVIDIMLKLMEGDFSGRRYIVNGFNMSYKELFTKIATAFNKKPPQRMLPLWLASIICKLENIRSRITGTEARITPQSMRAANSIQQYSAAKIQEALGFTFRSADESFADTAHYYRSQLSYPTRQTKCTR